MASRCRISPWQSESVTAVSLGLPKFRSNDRRMSWTAGHDIRLQNRLKVGAFPVLRRFREKVRKAVWRKKKFSCALGGCSVEPGDDNGGAIRDITMESGQDDVVDISWRSRGACVRHPHRRVAGGLMFHNGAGSAGTLVRIF